MNTGYYPIVLARRRVQQVCVAQAISDLLMVGKISDKSFSSYQGRTFKNQFDITNNLSNPS